MVLKELRDNDIEVSSAIIAPEAFLPFSSSSICALAIMHSHEYEFADSVLEQQCQSYIASQKFHWYKSTLFYFRVTGKNNIQYNSIQEPI